jgi:DNA mismatch repair ATPase MutL
MRKLPSDLCHHIRSQILILNFAMAIEECVVNSLDAGASQIFVRLNLEDFGFSVADNGEGMDSKALEIVPKRYWTSKLTSSTDIVSNNQYGWRGESLASLAGMSWMTITSRTKQAPGTIEKVMRGSEVTNFGRATRIMVKLS